MDSRLRQPERIYEYYIEISRPKDGEDGQITSVYPKDHDIEDDTRKQLPKFAFPTNFVNHNEEHFTFVLTDLDSKYRFGFCHYRPKGETCMCFISDLPWYKVFYRALDKISELKLDMQNELVEPLLSGLYSHPLPSPGEESLRVTPSGSTDHTLSYSFPLPTPNRRLPEIPTDHNLTYFYTSIHHNVLLHLFANMIYERRIIITSNSLSLLSASVHGCVMLLYPLHWQHIFIPIMPQHLKDYCAAPMPFLMGIHSSLMDEVRRMPIDDVVILDMDENVVESPHVEDLSTMPNDVIAELKHVLKKESSGYGDNACKAFLLAMVSMIGGYRKALKFREGESEVVFDEKVFFTSRPQMEEFLSSLLHFQHFRQFINQKIEQLKNQSVSRDLFDREVMFYDEELKGNTQEQIKTAFNKFLVSTKGGGKKLLERGEKFVRRAKEFKVVDKKTIRKLKKAVQDVGKDSRLGDLHNGPASSEKSNTFPLASQPETAVKKPPPRVIPYHKHQEGKKRLAEVLLQQSQRTSSASLDHGNRWRMLTPPDTPHSLPLPDDHMEKASLDSRGSTEEASASVSSGEVATGTLIDLADESRGSGVAGEGGGGEPCKDEAEAEQRDRSSTGSDSMVSTASSSSEDLATLGGGGGGGGEGGGGGGGGGGEGGGGGGGGEGGGGGGGGEGGERRGWVNFDDDGPTPPLPPPRSELDDLATGAGAILANPAVSEQLMDFNPFSRVPDPSNAAASGRVSPFEDFSTQIAQTLFTQSRNRTSLDAYTANVMESTCRDLYMAVDTRHVAPDRRESQTSLPEPLIPTSSSASISSLGGNCTTVLPSTNPFASLPLKSTANGFPGSPGHPLMQRECVRPRGPPPPKPQPYSGKPLSALTLPGGRDDPFSNLLEGMTMQAYASSGPIANVQLPSDSTSPQHRGPAAVESPLV